MKKYIILALLFLIGVSSAYTTEQQNVLDGVKLSFQLGVAYQKASQGTDISNFNALVDQYNAWVRTTFGEDASLLMQKMTTTTPADLTKPYLASNNTTGNGIVHAIDGSGKYGSSYTTNDINTMPTSAIGKYASQDTLYNPDGTPIPGTRNMGDGYLGGV
jgi:hypothetical protein